MAWMTWDDTVSGIMEQEQVRCFQARFLRISDRKRTIRKWPNQENIKTHNSIEKTDLQIHSNNQGHKKQGLIILGKYLLRMRGIYFQFRCSIITADGRQVHSLL
jgi:hypothetical protein